ncbi:MAG TPA: TolC family protein, partial [Polyangiaceae bacterium]|nr:TolC family protein [Polyangiaceae bacterium]
DAVLGKFYPKLTGTARYTRLSEVAVPAGFESFIPPFDQWALQATLTIPVSDYVLRLSTALSGASKNEDAAKLTARAEELLVQTDARVAYYTWVKAKGAEYVATKAKEQVDTALKDVKQSFQMGVASKADVLRTEAQFFQSELRVLRAKQAVQVATENLRTVMHETEAKEYLVGESLLDELTVANIPTIEAGIDEARVKRLELQSLVKMEEATRDRATLAKVAYYPRLDLQGNALYAQPNTRVFPYNDGQWHGTWDASVVLSWTPTDIPQAMGEAGSATARASEIAAQRRAMEDGLRVEVAAAISEMNNTLASVQTTREALKSAEEGFRVRTELFKAGRATTLEVTDAQNALTAARLELVFAHADARIARDKLTHVLGRDVTAPSE